jgi:4-hydroxybenzoate polyprenyltransferase
LSVQVARSVAWGLLLVSLPLAFWLSTWFAVMVLAYLLLNLAYTRWLKHIAIVDVMVLAERYGGGGHRKAAGASLAGSLADVQEQVLAEARRALG